MSKSSPNSSENKPTLAIDEAAWLARIGPKRHRLLCLWTREVVGALDSAIADRVTPDAAVLDAGCSRGEQDLPALLRARLTVGCDVDLAGLRANTFERDRVAASLEALPIADNSIHLIAAKWVVEHLPNPTATFREFWRVLRPGGFVAILTPNVRSPLGILSQLIPHCVKQRVKERVFGGLREDTFATPYRSNTPTTLRAAMVAAGFTLIQFRLLAGMWAFLIFNEPLARLARGVERAQLALPGLCGLSAHMLGVWQKPLAGGG